MAAFVTLALLAYLYFLPSILGRKKRNAAAIIWLNLLGGWTGLGWLVALAWSLSKETPTVVAPAPKIAAPVATRVAAPVPAPPRVMPTSPSATRVAGPVKAQAKPEPPILVAPLTPPTPAAKPLAVSVADELERLFNLKEKGALTEQEYNMHKANILA
jgi:hypothetical protein